MHFFVRAVVTGFALSLGAALYKKLEKELGVGEKRDAAPTPTTVPASGATT